MSVETVALFDHPFSANDLIQAPVRLNVLPLMRYIARWIPPHLLESRRLSWQWKDQTEPNASIIEAAWNQEQWIRLDGPWVFSLSFGRRACQLYSGIRWRAFIDNAQGIQENFRFLCTHLATELRSSQILYLPDCDYQVAYASAELCKGRNVQGISEWLQQYFGPPALSIQAIRRDTPTGHIDLEGYYIDDLSAFLAGLTNHKHE